MKAQPACLPCCLARILRVAELVTDDVWLHSKILSEMMDVLRKRQYDTSPAELVSDLFQRTTRILGVADPYAERKAVIQDEMATSESQFREWIAAHPKPLVMAARLACVGNLFDDDLLRDADVPSMFEAVGRVELRTTVWDEFRRHVKDAGRIMFLHGAAGEICLDKFLLERWQDKEITSVVRAAPLLNWATADDAGNAGIARLAARVIDPGPVAIGLPLSECTPQFRERFEEADVVIAKGQAYWELLEGQPKCIYVLMRVKCRVVAESLGARIGDLVLERC